MASWRGKDKSAYREMLAARVIGLFARLWGRKHRDRIDWDLADALLSEGVPREDLVVFFGVGETYLRTILERRKRASLSPFGFGKKTNMARATHRDG